jgi:hypothetical protein
MRLRPVTVLNVPRTAVPGPALMMALTVALAGSVWPGAHRPRVRRGLGGKPEPLCPSAVAQLAMGVSFKVSSRLHSSCCDSE